jgi:hypothetical protein
MEPQVRATLDLDTSETEFAARPEIGKKVAKRKKFDADKGQKTTPRENEWVLAINRLVKATKEKTIVLAHAAEEKAKILFFNALPDSDPTRKQFIALRAAKFLANEQLGVASHGAFPSANTSKDSGHS